MNENNHEKEYKEQDKSSDAGSSQEDKPLPKSWTFSAANRNDQSCAEDEFISKTELKNDAKELHKFGQKLILLSSEQMSLLSLNDSTKIAVADFHKQVGNIAKKRQLAFIAKCLRSDDVTESMKIVNDNSFAQVRAVAAHRLNKAKAEKLDNESNFIELLVSNADQQIQLLIEQYPDLNRQTLRQLVRNIQKAKTEKKLLQAKSKVLEFVKNNNVDLANFDL